MIAEQHKAGVSRALREAFGVTEFEGIRAIPAGLGSNLDFQIVVRGSLYLLRIMTRIDERMDPVRIFSCMSAAAGAGLTPCVRYVNAAHGIAITDYVEAVQFSPVEALIQVPDMLRRLHTLPPFPKTFNYDTAHNGFIWRFRNANILPEQEVEEVFKGYQQICATYPRLDSDMVSCHMDLKPENLLFDGRRLWLVEWQAAFVNDRYFDLAVAANFLIVDQSDEFVYLKRYFGQAPDRYRRARFFLMRQVLHMLTATVFLI